MDIVGVGQLRFEDGGRGSRILLRDLLDGEVTIHLKGLVGRFLRDDSRAVDWGC